MGTVVVGSISQGLTGVARRVRPRVVVTGMGIVNPLGVSGISFWRALLDGRRAIAPLGRCDCTGLPVTLGAEIRGFDAREYVPGRFLVKSDRFTHYALVASGQALQDAGLDARAVDPRRIGISFGNNSGGWD